MSRALGYDFSEEQLRHGIYFPRGRFDLQQTQLAVLNGAFVGMPRVPFHEK